MTEPSLHTVETVGVWGFASPEAYADRAATAALRADLERKVAAALAVVTAPPAFLEDEALWAIDRGAHPLTGEPQTDLVPRHRLADPDNAGEPALWILRCTARGIPAVGPRPSPATGP